MIDIEDEDLVPMMLNDQEVWILDPDLLHPSSECDGVLAVQYVAGQLWVLDGTSRTWIDAANGAPKTKLKPVR